MTKKKQPQHDWLDILYKIFSIGTPILALILSGYAIIRSELATKSITEYQISQERLPRITGLNQEMVISIKTNTKGTVDFSNVPENLYPFSISVYNVGVGIAQNCVLEWDKADLQDAYQKIKELFKEETSLRVTDYSFFPDYGVMSWGDYDYIFEKKRDEYISVIYSGANGYIQDDMWGEILRCPYILPISVQEKEIFICLPNSLSALLLEAANQGIASFPSVTLHSKFQDLTGREYEESFIVAFSLVEYKKVENKTDAVYYISFQTVPKTQ